MERVMVQSLEGPKEPRTFRMPFAMVCVCAVSQDQTSPTFLQSYLPGTYNRVTKSANFTMTLGSDFSRLIMLYTIFFSSTNSVTPEGRNVSYRGCLYKCPQTTGMPPFSLPFTAL